MDVVVGMLGMDMDEYNVGDGDCDIGLEKGV